MANPTPAPCQAIEAELKKKKAQRDALNNAPRPGGPVFKPGRDVDPETKALKARLSKEIQSLESKLTQCFVQNTPNAPLTVRFQSIFCEDQDDVEVSPFEDDEPYMLVFALNLPRFTRITNPASLVPDARVFKIGRFSGVDSGDTKSGAVNVWDTNGNGRVINDPDDVTIIAAMMEEDLSGADAMRTNVQSLMIPEVVKALPALASDPEAFRFRLMEGMRGAIKTAAKIGAPNPDDVVGDIRQIRLTRPILDRVRRFGSHRFDLSFTSPSARYSAVFNLIRA